MTTNPAVNSDCILQFYRHLYSEDGFQHPSLDVVEFSRIFEENVEWLERPFEEEEAFGVIQHFNSNKAPGPDGYSMGFSNLYGVSSSLT